MKPAASKGKLKIACFILGLLVLTGCQTASPMKGDLTQILKDRMQDLADGGVFLGSIGVVSQGKVILQEGYGWADVEKKIPCTKDTNYAIASVTKQFTAAGLLYLADQGKISPQDTLDKWVPEYPRGGEVTLHQLATNSSGLPYTFPNKEDQPDMDRPITPVEIVDRFENTPFKYKPGTQFDYSNYGFVLLGLAISRASGMSYEDFVEKEFFKPNGMDRSALNDAPDLATGYLITDDLIPADKGHSTWAYAAGAVESNVVDMGKWLDALASGKVLSPASLKTLMTPEFKDYAYGWWSREISYRGRTVTVLTHGGNLPGFESQALLIPELRLSVVALSNQTEVFQALLEEIMELVLAHLEE